MDSMLDGLNSAQRAAVTSPASVLQILAPPGSGKTKTLTSRVAYLLSNHKYKPWNVICLTFTIKSSKEMKERISKLVERGIEKKLILGTFHSVCRRYLIAYGHLIGLQKDFGIADSSDQISIIKRIQKRLGLSIDPKIAQSRISHAKSKGLSYHDLVQRLLSKKDVEQQELVTLFEAYEDHLTRSNLLDYDDLLVRCAYLLKTYPSCVSNVEVVLVDEFQDTNVVQFELLRLFAATRNRITTVGDPDQSIYGWRSADVENLKKMQKLYPETLIIRLEDNYRSSGAILLAAQELIEQDESRPQKSILPTHCPGTVPVLRKIPSAADESEWTVSEIQRMICLTGRLLEYSDFAILLRSAALSRLLESAMGKAGIPYRMVGGQKFFDRVEIKILLDYLRIVDQPHNNDALIRIINVPARGIGTTTIKSLLEEAEVQKVSLWALIPNGLKGHKSIKTKISKTAEQGLGSIINIVMTIRKKLLDLDDPPSPEHLLRHIIKKLDFQAYLEKSYTEDHEARWANVEELVAQASEYHLSESKDEFDEAHEESLPDIDGVEQEKGSAAEEQLSKFLANVALAAAVDVAKEDNDDGSQAQSQVTISTIHAAKGLEWPVVFIPSAYEGSIPHSRAEDTDEERRLLYVAMTRAQVLLNMSCPTKNSHQENTKLSPFLSAKKVSRFLTNQGPRITMSNLADIARILRRDCPSAAEVEEASRHMQNPLDNQWPLTGEENLAAIQNRRSKWDNYQSNDTVDQHISKKHRTTKEMVGSSYTIGRTTTVIGNTTTMEKMTTAFSYRGNVGFSSAAAELHLRRKACHERHPTEQKTSRMPNNPANINRNTKESSATLLSMWGTSTKDSSKVGAGQRGKMPSHQHPLDLDHSHEVVSARSLPGNTRREDSIEATSTTSLAHKREALSAIPPQLASHRLNPAVLIKKKLPPAVAPAEHIFPSSSPPAPESDRSAATPVPNPIDDDDENDENDDDDDDQTPQQPAAKPPPGPPVVLQPAEKTMHEPTTTAAEVAATTATKILSPSHQPQQHHLSLPASTIKKKTLGIRRNNMLNWSDRPRGSGFKPPTMMTQRGT